MRHLLITALCGLALPGGAQQLPAPLTPADFAPVDLREAKLGQLLFYDPILSGNRNVACATCHHPKFGTSDGVSLSIGDGGTGLGPNRVANPDNIPEQRLPRHAQALFNLGAREFTVLFNDGRIEADSTRPSGLRTPLEDEMLEGFASLLSAQTMFPVLSADEMAGHYSENEISQAVRLGRITGTDGAWDLLSRRVGGIAAYADEFIAIFPHITAPEDIAFTDISNVIASFVAHEWRSDTSPFDAYLRGEATLPEDALVGLNLFYGKAGCARCHSGAFQTDHGFHAMGQPQFGPGKAARFESHQRDTGRMRVTGDPQDAYAFRTPSLRNVTLTAPYGHTGAYPSLEGFLAAHGRGVDPGYDRALPILPALEAGDWWVLDRPEEIAEIAQVAEVFDHQTSAREIARIVAFLETLEDPVARTGRLGVPRTVPSGLAVPD